MTIRSRVVAAAAAIFTIVVGMPTAGAGPGAQSATWCEATDAGYRCMYGPVAVPAGDSVEIIAGSAAPSETGYITRARATLVDAAGEELDHHAVHLHHAVWLNPKKDDTTCSNGFDGLFPSWDRFFATGKERTLFDLPDGYGYLWEPDMPQSTTQSSPYWGLVAHLDGMEGAADVFIELDMDFVPVVEETLIDIDPIWLDVRNCEADPVFTVRRGSGRDGRYTERWSYEMPVGGRFVWLGGHLHDGGIKLSLFNKTRGTNVFTSRARYGMHHEPWFLTRMTSFVSPDGPRISAGDRLSLRATYDSTHRWVDVMGIMVGALVVKD